MFVKEALSRYLATLIKARSSLRSKRFRRVWEQRKTEERVFGILPARKMGREPKKERWG